MNKTIDFYGKTINMKGLKDEIMKMQELFSKLLRIKQWGRELSNYGGKESKTDYFMMFGEREIRDADGFMQKVKALTFADPFTYADAKLIAPALMDIFGEHVHITDNRKTAEQRQQEAEERQQAELEHKRKREEQRKHNEPLVGFFYDANKESEAVPVGKFPITIGAYFNNSDPMSDYYDPSASVDCTAALCFVDAGTKRTEHLFRKIVNAIPQLAAMKWEWEDNSRGYTLKSGVFATLQYPSYRKGNQVACWLEIRMCNYDKNLPKSPLFLEAVPTTASNGESAAVASNGGVTIRLNAAQGGVEIVHDKKPSPATIESIKREGFRWARHNKCWYKRDTPAARAAAERLTGLKLQGEQQPESIDQGGYLLDALEEIEEQNFARM